MAPSTRRFGFAALAAVAAGATTKSLSCLDGAGKADDFWYAFKAPSTWQYTYMSKDVKLTTPSGTLEDDDSALKRTFDQLYSGSKDDITYALWNDEHADGSQVGGPHAHAKGLLAFKGDQGFWITHTIPQFPAKTSSKKPFSSGSPKVAQSFLCITIDRKGLDSIGELFALDWVSVYEAKDGANIGDTFSAWATVGGKQQKDTDSTKVENIVSKGGQSFVAFAKTGEWDKGLWDDLVAPHFKTAFLTETWQNGIGRMDSECKGSTTVENILTVKFPGADEWKESQDHSKWGVAKDGSVLCLGDINRQDGQAHRGGGAVCIESKTLAKQILGVVTSIEKCDHSVLTV